MIHCSKELNGLLINFSESPANASSSANVIGYVTARHYTIHGFVGPFRSTDEGPIREPGRLSIVGSNWMHQSRIDGKHYWFREDNLLGRTPLTITDSLLGFPRMVEDA